MRPGRQRADLVDNLRAACGGGDRAAGSQPHRGRLRCLAGDVLSLLRCQGFDWRRGGRGVLFTVHVGGLLMTPRSLRWKTCGPSEGSSSHASIAGERLILLREVLQTTAEDLLM